MTEFLNSLDFTSVVVGFIFCMVSDVFFCFANCALEKAFALRKARREYKLNTPYAGEKEGKI